MSWDFFVFDIHNPELRTFMLNTHNPELGTFMLNTHNPELGTFVLNTHNTDRLISISAVGTFNLMINE